MTDITMPQLGETVTEGTITKWFKKVGDAVAADEPLFEVSTEKVDTEVPAPMAGYLAEIKVPEGDTVEVGAVLAVISEQATGASAPPAAEPAAPAAAVPAVAEAEPPAAPPAPPAPPPASPPPAATVAAAAVSSDGAASDGAAATEGAGNKLLSPVVRRLVAEHGLDPASIVGTGAGGRITREDVLDHLDKHGSAPAPASVAAPAAAPAPAAPAPAAPAPAAAREPGQRDEVVALPKIRKLTGDHMVMSLATSPHSFSVVEVDYENVDRVRRAHMDSWHAQEGFVLSYMPFVSRAIVDAIAEFPRMNATVGEGELTLHHYVDLGIAVDLNYEGLLVPVIRDADSKRLRAIAREIYDLASRARSRKLGPDEIRGGTFTISNNGWAGSVLTAAIINQPQVAIISTDAVKRHPVVAELPDGGEAIVIHSVGNLAMSWDHRAFDGVYAAHFLVKVKEILETRDWEAEL